MPFEADQIAPLNKMAASEHVLVIGAAPNKHSRSQSITTLARAAMNESACARHFKDATFFYGFRSEEKRLGRLGVRIGEIKRQISVGRSSIHADNHISCGRVSTVFPSRLDCKASQVERVL